MTAPALRFPLAGTNDGLVWNIHGPKEKNKLFGRHDRSDGGEVNMYYLLSRQTKPNTQVGCVHSAVNKAGQEDTTTADVKTKWSGNYSSELIIPITLFIELMQSLLAGKSRTSSPDFADR